MVPTINANPKFFSLFFAPLTITLVPSIFNFGVQFSVFFWYWISANIYWFCLVFIVIFVRWLLYLVGLRIASLQCISSFKEFFPILFPCPSSQTYYSLLDTENSVASAWSRMWVGRGMLNVETSTHLADSPEVMS